MGPPTAAGRWSLTTELLAHPATPTEAAAAVAQQLLDRHGVLTREAMRAEAIHGGFSAVYPVLKALEEAGRVRRGYVVAGLGAAQFAAPGAIDRLRAGRETGIERDAETVPSVLVLAATDPAQPYGAALPWPATDGRPSRSAGAFVVLVDGTPVAQLERGGRSLTTFPAAERDAALWVPHLLGLVDRQRLRKLEITKVDGTDVHETGWVDHLVAAGASSGYRGVLYRGTSPKPASARR